MPRPIDITLDAIAHGGEAVGRLAGKAVFVPFAVPGEKVRIEIVDERERWARARLLEVLDPSPDRIVPPCPYFGPDQCGGCQWQHIAYERQVLLKGEIVTDQLRRLGRIAMPAVADVTALADEEGYLDYGYRNHVQFSTTPEGRLGYRRAGGREVIAVDRCLLLSERLDQLHAALDLNWPALKGATLRAAMNTGQALVLLETEGGDQPEVEIDLPAACALRTPGGLQPLIGEPWIEEEVAGRRYRISAESSFQVNTVGAQALVEIVAAYAGLAPTDVLLDAYCGVGLFALALAGSAAAVIGIESSPSACEDFAHNALGLDSVSLYEGPVDAVLPALAADAQRVDVAIIDPPRAGAGSGVIHDLAALGPRRVVYVSCDPATLGRDSVYLTEAGYVLIEAQPVDMFPQTYHVETVALWGRR